ncbi:SDR family NAD(P)-dependent oxidoreductase [Pseudomonas sp. H3(2019)]|uniref:SDR family NAD(P)-dependent oxidoreductase n=1 Tax=Pseudomonas sp. H3(2019) TaxID=2598724 RepID=UPI0011978172|nr:SDR family oxidoreductase [Pseudomonas sp. H3(2019)]TVT86080.1 SDR family oxidoreductase [Pseudomonas sp. H3(2019)]
MTMNNHSKWVVLTGATRGIGRAIAGHLAQAGYDLILPTRDPATAEHVALELKMLGARAVVYPCDLSIAQQVEDFAKTVLKEMGTPYGFVSCAGMTCDGLSFQLDIAKVQKTFQVNLFSTMQLTGQFAMPMGRAGGGRIVLISSVSAWLGNRGNAAYAATKGGLQAYMKSVLEEFSRRGVTINAVLPGFINTDMTQGRDEWIERMSKRIPAQRVGTPDDVANAVGFLLAPGASYINGAELAVDGGMSATLGLN